MQIRLENTQYIIKTHFIILFISKCYSAYTLYIRLFLLSVNSLQVYQKINLTISQNDPFNYGPSTSFYLETICLCDDTSAQKVVLLYQSNETKTTKLALGQKHIETSVNKAVI